MINKEVLELLSKYGKCPECGNESIGKGHGILEVDENLFRRTCECGFEVEVKNGEVTKKSKWG